MMNAKEDIKLNYKRDQESEMMMVECSSLRDMVAFLEDELL